MKCFRIFCIAMECIDIWTQFLESAVDPRKFTLSKWGKVKLKKDHCMMMINLGGGMVGGNQVSTLLRTNISEAIKRQET